MKMNARIGCDVNGNYQLIIGKFSIITMKERHQAEAIRDGIRKNLVELTECTRRDLCEMAGFHRSQCVSDLKNKRIGVSWGRNLTDEWNMIHKASLMLDHEDLPDDQVMEEPEPVKMLEERIFLGDVFKTLGLSDDTQRFLNDELPESQSDQAADGGPA